MLEVNENEIETIIVIANKAKSKVLGMREYLLFTLVDQQKREPSVNAARCKV
jgi:hypothetical protein